ncbi:hypothetical protein PVAND_016882 [Polypedilum vanderplanki]|uniref:Uncharacterized protein n=1 Tax=Polypedilum vanderplanki TaxID=319348 RepID=A0A9J6BHH8_POLVA|nr:hypothetical protein PVAND_016882 [Polypedilum vanderplanki]
MKKSLQLSSQRQHLQTTISLQNAITKLILIILANANVLNALKCVCDVNDCDLIKADDCPGRGLLIWDPCRMKKFLLFLVLNLFNLIENFTINCEFATVQIYISDSDVYNCNSINIPNYSGDTITEVTGTHQNNKTNYDVESIWFYGNSTLDFFPRGITKFFPNIKAVWIEDTQILELNGDELDEFGDKLVYFFYRYSNLTTISSSLLKKTPNVVYFLVAYTKLQHVGFDLFTSHDITKLQWLSFAYNSCIHMWDDSQNGIQNIMDKLKIQCPYDDENLPKISTEMLSTSTD